MLEKGKMSAYQMGLLMYPLILATGFITLPVTAGEYAKNDLWMTPLVASICGLISVLTAIRLHELYPKQTPIQYSTRIAGKIPGKILGIAYFLLITSISGTVTRQYADFVTGNFLFKTPILLVIFSILLLAAFAVRGGVEMIARSATIFTPFFILPTFFLLFLIPDLDVRNLFPVLHHGWVPVLKGAAMPQAWFSEYFLISFFLPYLTDPQKGRKWGVLSLSAAIMSLTYVNIITLFLLGVDSSNKMYPILVAFRYISLGNFFENLESLLLAMWVLGNFVKIGGFYYTAALSLAQCLSLSDYRPVVFPVGLLIMACSLWGLPTFAATAIYNRFIIPFELPLMLTVIPLLLLLTAIFKRKALGKGGAEQ
ncbi:endospore germination permease [Paenibacillus sp. NPDC056579]|uniref:GerAB/ArcD/ProY family transporter n=1 Tax=Paenibacillus sp. NPDC056579 TaxID=3345871 RepID=UPI0036A3B70C